MVLHVDTTNKRLISSPTNSLSPSAPIFTRGDAETVEVRLYTYANGEYTALLLSGGEVLRLGLGKTSQGKVLYAAASVNSFDSGIARLTVNLNTSNLADALAGLPSVEALVEVELTDSNNKVITLLQERCTIKNDVLEGEESPYVLPSARTVYDSEGNVVAGEKGEWRTVKISTGVYTQKFVRID